MSEIKKVTPMISQYLEVKSRHRDAILFFRLGDFYEMFFEDAIRASEILGITLTSRNKNSEESVPLCGIPYHSASSYISKLLKNGIKVAICEQLEDPKLAKGIVKRDVLRVITPSLRIYESDEERGGNNYLFSLFYDNTTIGFSFIDIETGEFKFGEYTAKTQFENELYRINPREILIQDSLADSYKKAINGSFYVTQLDTSQFDYENSLLKIKKHFGRINLDYLVNLKSPLCSIGAILSYVELTQKSLFANLNPPALHSLANYMGLDSVSIRNLEIFEPLNQGGGQSSKGTSLFEIMNETNTKMGERRLKFWLTYPLTRRDLIEKRLLGLCELKDKYNEREEIRILLKLFPDIERINGKIAFGTVNPRDLIALKKGISRLPDIKKELLKLNSQFINELIENFDTLTDLYELIEKTIVDEPPQVMKEGKYIRTDYGSELADLVKIIEHGHEFLQDLEARERARAGISSLKVRFNQVFGYYIEVTRANLHLVPSDYIRKQTLSTGERYITEELKKFEERMLTAVDDRIALEAKIFDELRKRLIESSDRINKVGELLANLDVISTFAHIAVLYNYTMPVILDDSTLVIEESRHPVLERKSHEFIPNDISLDSKENQIILITGPNMAGKSTLMRQVALTTIMAQVGSFVSAKKAEIGIVDRIFTRVGAMDNISEGKSTFMVEMNETSLILKSATEKSLILLDEVGRGTSTFDGISIAWAVCEDIHDRIGARTLFATHYHELTDIARIKKKVKNFNVAVKEWNRDIIFLRKLEEGCASKSYGIQVAKLAGIPENVTNRAFDILSNLEGGELNETGMPNIGKEREEKPKKGQLDLFSFNSNDRIIGELKKIDIENLTPIEALIKLHELKNNVD